MQSKIVNLFLNYYEIEKNGSSIACFSSMNFIDEVMAWYEKVRRVTMGLVASWVSLHLSSAPLPERFSTYKVSIIKNTDLLKGYTN